MAAALDIRTLTAAAGINSLVLAASLIYVLRTRRTYSGFRSWVLAYLLTAAAWILIALRGQIPDLFSIVVGNLLGAGHLVLVHRGLMAFTGGRQRTGRHLAALAALLAAFAYLTLIAPSLSGRIVVGSAFVAVYCFLCADVARRRLPLVLGSGNGLVVWTLALTGAWYVLRIAVTARGARLDDFMTAGTIHALAVVVTMTAANLMTLGPIAVNLQRVERDVLAAREEVRVLKGILPICSGCKRIRDEKGNWSPLEVYIHRHSEADFSHGVCPECLARLYPEYARD